jgi:hypothetical protein
MMGADKAAKLGCATAPLANRSLKTPALRKVMEKAIGLSADRALPNFAGTTFVQRFKKHRQAVADPQRKVAFFVDVYANYNDPDLGMAAVEQLASLGCEVVVPKQEACGYPFIAYGDMDRARQAAAAPGIAEGQTIRIPPSLPSARPRCGQAHTGMAAATRRGGGADRNRNLLRYGRNLRSEGRPVGAQTLHGRG